MLQGIAHIAQSSVERRTINLKGVGSIRDTSIILPYYNLYAKTLMCVYTDVVLNLVSTHYSILSS